MKEQQASIPITTLSRGERRVYNLLAEGGKYSAADIASRLHLCDPYSYLRRLRKKGVVLLHETRISIYETRYRVYSLKPNETPNGK